MKTDFYDKLQYLFLVVQDQCKKNHISLVYYVLNRSKGKESKKFLDSFKKLSAVNDDFEKNYKSIFAKYRYQVEGRTGGEAVVNPDELLAFTKAYELQKAEIKKEIEMLSALGASNSLLEPLEQDLLTWAQFHMDFYEHIQIYQE